MRQVARFHEGQEGGAAGRGDLLKFMNELNAMALRFRLPTEVRNRARSVCMDAAAMRVCREIPCAVLATAALYVACREFKEPLTLRELAEAGGCDYRDVGRCYASILERMHISRPSLNGKTYVHHLILKQSLSDETYKLSEEIIRKSSLGGLGGRNPMTLAAAALYLACCSMGERVTQAEVADAAGVGEESVRECCKAIRISASIPSHGSTKPELSTVFDRGNDAKRPASLAQMEE
jgi:transcription initiation factor TFIIB